MSAKEMFEKLGYELDNETKWYPERYKYICYKNDLVIMLFSISEDDIHFEKFYYKLGIKQNDCCNYACAISYKELQAINKQVEELEESGWNKWEIDNIDDNGIEKLSHDHEEPANIWLIKETINEIIDKIEGEKNA